MRETAKPDSGVGGVLIGTTPCRYVIGNDYDDDDNDDLKLLAH